MGSDSDKGSDHDEETLDPADADDEAVRRLAREQAEAGDVKPTPGA